MSPEIEKKIKELLAQATIGLQDDQMLREEASEELRSHLEARILEASEEGLDETAAFEVASEEFGEPGAMATSLVSANAQKLKTRARMSFFIRRVLVPVSVAIALVTGFQELRRLAALSRFTSVMDGLMDSDLSKGSFLMRFSMPPQDRIARGLSEGERRIVFSQFQEIEFMWSDPALSTANTAKELWESDAENPAYFVAYLTSLLTHDGTLPEDMVEFGDRIDPGNAYYRVLRASELVAKGMEDEGYQILKKASSMERFERYYGALQEHRSEILGAPKSLLEQADRLWLLAAAPLPDVAKIQNLSKLFEDRAKASALAGDVDGMRELIDTWWGFSRNFTEDVTYLIEGLLANSLIVAGRKNLAEPCRSIGLIAEAEQIEAAAKKAENFHDTYWNRRPDVEGMEGFVKHASNILGISTSGMGRGISLPSGDALVPGRATDYLQIDRVAVMILIVILFLAMATYGITGAFKRKKHGAPMVLLLRLKDYAMILALGLGMPVVLYLLITRLTPLGGHGVAVNWGLPVWAFQVAAFGFLVFALLALVTRWRLAGVDARFGGWGRIVLVSLILVVVSASVVAIFPESIFLQIIVISCAVGALVSIGVAGIRWWARIFRSASVDLARASIPVCALAIVLLATIAIPILNSRERYWVMRDTLLLPGDGGWPGGFTGIETEATELYREALMATLAGSPAIK